VSSHLLSLSPFPCALRGVSQDISSTKSTASIEKGVKMVVNKFDDPMVLEAAFKGASALFTVTDY
jgi:hypothetical protein